LFPYRSISLLHMDQSQMTNYRLLSFQKEGSSWSSIREGAELSHHRRPNQGSRAVTKDGLASPRWMGWSWIKIAWAEGEKINTGRDAVPLPSAVAWHPPAETRWLWQLGRSLLVLAAPPPQSRKRDLKILYIKVIYTTFYWLVLPWTQDSIQCTPYYNSWITVWINHLKKKQHIKPKVNMWA
jgi:hypothetical protein